MQKAIASSMGIRWGFVSLVAVCVVSTAATPVAAQVFDGDLVLETQAQVDAFSYTEVTGSVFVSSYSTDPITNVDGLSSLTSVGGYLYVSSNDSLTDLDGLSGLTSVGEFLAISSNDSLTDLDGLSSLTSVGGDLYVASNPSLSEFCGLYPLLAANGPGGLYYVYDNAASLTTKQDILDGGPCDPADTILELYEDGAINQGQALALMHLADQSPMGLAHMLEAFVRIGLLTSSEAQLVFVIATMP